MIPAPCPFCLATDDSVGAKLDRDTARWQSVGWYVECDRCLARGPKTGSLDAAIARWNAPRMVTDRATAASGVKIGGRS